MRTMVAQVLAAKGDDVWSLPPSGTVYEALQLMAEKRIGALLVVEGESLVGVVSERDYARKVILHDRDSRHTTISDIMTTDVRTVREDTTVGECMSMMTEHRTRHLPVLDMDHRLVGVISIGDVVKAVIGDQQFLIDQLEQYITT